MSSVGSPKTSPRPRSSSVSRPRWMVPIEADATLPYSVERSLTCSPTCCDVLDHRPQVLEVEQRQAMVVGNLEHPLQHAGLRIVELEQAGEEQLLKFLGSAATMTTATSTARTAAPPAATEKAAG